MVPETAVSRWREWPHRESFYDTVVAVADSAEVADSVEVADIVEKENVKDAGKVSTGMKVRGEGQPVDSAYAAENKLPASVSPIGGQSSEWERHLRERLSALEAQYGSRPGANFPEISNILFPFLKSALPAHPIIPRLFYREPDRGESCGTVACLWQVQGEHVLLTVDGDGTAVTLSYRGSAEDAYVDWGDAYTDQGKEFFTSRIADMTGNILGLFT